MSTEIYCGTSSEIIKKYPFISSHIIIKGDNQCSSINRRLIKTLIELNPKIEKIETSNIKTIESNSFKDLNNGISDEIQILFDDEITCLQNFAFSECNKIKKIILPSELTDETFGKYVFKNCTNLEKVYYKESSKFTIIPEGTFCNTNLNFIDIYDKPYAGKSRIYSPIKKIGKYSFEGTKLDTIYIWEHFLTIESYAFRSSSIKNVYFEGLDQSRFINDTSSISKFEFDNNTSPLCKYMTAVSKKQFRYKYTKITQEAEDITIILPEDFRYCTDSSHYMIFHNGRVVPPSFIVLNFTYNLIELSKTNQPSIYLNIPVVTNDIIEIFYLPMSLEPVNKLVDNLNSEVNENNNIIESIPESGYIRFNSPLYGKSSKHSLFIFVDGKKIPLNDLEDVSNTIIKILKSEECGKRIDIFSHVDELYQNIVYGKDGLTHQRYANSQSYHGRNKLYNVDLSSLPSYKDKSLLDKMLNNSSDERLNKLFDTKSSLKYNGNTFDSNYKSKSQVIQRILQDFELQNTDVRLNNIK